MMNKILLVLTLVLASFSLGNSIKNGIISRLNPQNVTNTNVNAKEAISAQNNVPTIMDGSIQASIEQGQAKNNRSAEVYCEIGFWISIAAVAINLIYLGIQDAPIVGAFLIFAAIYGGVRGLNTRKRKKTRKRANNLPFV